MVELSSTMRGLILLNPEPVIELCALCALPALYHVLFKITAYNPELAKEIIREMNLPVCEQHAERIFFKVEKQVISPKRILLV